MKRRTLKVVTFAATGRYQYQYPAPQPGATEEPELPSIGKRAMNFVRDAGKAVLGGLPRRSDADIQKILDEHCNGCSLSINKNTDNIQCTHPRCGCWMKWKARLATLHCPDGKW